MPALSTQPAGMERINAFTWIGPSPAPDTTLTPAMVEAEAARRISTTPIPKLDAGSLGRSNASHAA